MSQTKKAYRERANSILDNLSVQQRQTTEQKIRTNLFQLAVWKQAATIGVTVSRGQEWDTTRIIQHAWETGKQVAVPKAHPSDKTMTFYQLDDFAELKVGYYNLKEPDPETAAEVEPAQIDLLIVPGLIFDRSGYRIGFGGGFYDRFLEHFGQATVSLLSSRQLVDDLPTDEHDKPVDWLVTDEGVVSDGQD